MTWTRAQMMHQLLHWPDQADESLWPYTLNNAIHIWNNMPDRTSGLSPCKKFTGTKSPHGSNPLLSTQAWGCPAFVLDPTLQDGHKLPKFKKRSRCGVYLGHSPTHSRSIGCILNPETGHISPQCHVVCDELFSTVWGTMLETPFDEREWNEILELKSLEQYLDPDDQDTPNVLARATDLFRDDLDDDNSVIDPDTPCLLLPPRTSVPEGDDETSTSSTDPETDSSDDATSVSEGGRMRLRSGRTVPLRGNADYASTLLLPLKFQISDFAI